MPSLERTIRRGESLSRNNLRRDDDLLWSIVSRAPDYVDCSTWEKSSSFLIPRSSFFNRERNFHRNSLLLQLETSFPSSFLSLFARFVFCKFLVVRTCELWHSRVLVSVSQPLPEMQSYIYIYSLRIAMYSQLWPGAWRRSGSCSRNCGTRTWPLLQKTQGVCRNGCTSWHWSGNRSLQRILQGSCWVSFILLHFFSSKKFHKRRWVSPNQLITLHRSINRPGTGNEHLRIFIHLQIQLFNVFQNSSKIAQKIKKKCNQPLVRKTTFGWKIF